MRAPFTFGLVDPLRLTPVKIRRVLFFVALLEVIFVSLLSGSNVEEYVSDDIQQNGGIVHLVCYCTLSAVALWAYGRRSRVWKSRVVAILFCAAFGALMELLQQLPLIGRCGSLSDIRDNVVGALVSGLFFPKRWWPRLGDLLEKDCRS